MTGRIAAAGAMRTSSLHLCAPVVEVDAAKSGLAGEAVTGLLRDAGFTTAAAGNGTRLDHGAFCAIQLGNAALGASGSCRGLRRSVVAEAASRMAKRGGGRIVLVTDANPWPAAGANVDQSARQIADLHWWQQLAARVARYGVRMNTVRIGYSPFLGHALSQPSEADLFAHQVIRRPVTETDLACALTLLFSKGMNGMVGEVLPLDGGVDSVLVPVSAPGTVRADFSTVPPANPWPLTGRTIMITGASSGIGAETAIELARRGADLVLTARRQRELDQIAGAVREHLGTRVWTLSADLADRETPALLAKQAFDEAGMVHDLVYAAGILTRDEPGADSRPHRERSFRVNTLSYADLAEEFAARWVERKHRGSIVGVSSVSAQSAPVPQVYSYGSSKAAMAQLGSHLAVTLARYRIRVNSVLPGIVRTPMTDAQDPAFVSASLRRIPALRLCEPEDIAAAIGYLVSPAASYLTGAQLRVCGGSATLRTLPALGKRKSPEGVELTA
ncbi:SDR family NAD(P)-dependent oxidoreductase [Amycolatopsis anabasis]|uniref:SDR family NAD(P)-dependent oxidoreductase n=1 Tax=Amycolatopsis anabasis TaxID=1840409 RepID=UPI00131B9725|nr:SDR family NAD(P)-dependent oxidoreductase [Amycolatopsis anabasis]